MDEAVISDKNMGFLIRPRFGGFVFMISTDHGRFLVLNSRYEESWKYNIHTWDSLCIIWGLCRL